MTRFRVQRDLLALDWVVLAERSSFGAYTWLWRHRLEIWARQGKIQARRTVPPAEVERWFGVDGNLVPWARASPKD